jgi:hypothetical protein
MGSDKFSDSAGCENALQPCSAPHARRRGLLRDEQCHRFLPRQHPPHYVFGEVCRHRSVNRKSCSECARLKTGGAHAGVRNAPPVEDDNAGLAITHITQPIHPGTLDRPARAGEARR